MSKERDLVGFILNNGGMRGALSALIKRDSFSVLGSATFWSILIHWVFLSAYSLALVAGMVLSVLYFIYLALSPEVDAKSRNGALVTLGGIVLLLGILRLLK